MLGQCCPQPCLHPGDPGAWGRLDCAPERAAAPCQPLPSPGVRSPHREVRGAAGRTRRLPSPCRWRRRIRPHAGAGDSRCGVTQRRAGAVQAVPVPQSWRRAWGSGCGAGWGRLFLTPVPRRILPCDNISFPTPRRLRCSFPWSTRGLSPFPSGAQSKDTRVPVPAALHRGPAGRDKGRGGCGWSCLSMPTPSHVLGEAPRLRFEKDSSVPHAKEP